MDLRCLHRKFGVVITPATNEDASLEIACPSRWCGKREGVTVLHLFSTKTGELLKTRWFQTPRGGGK